MKYALTLALLFSSTAALADAQPFSFKLGISYGTPQSEVGAPACAKQIKSIIATASKANEAVEYSGVGDQIASPWQAGTFDRGTGKFEIVMHGGNVGSLTLGRSFFGALSQATGTAIVSGFDRYGAELCRVTFEADYTFAQ